MSTPGEKVPRTRLKTRVLFFAVVVVASGWTLFTTVDFKFGLNSDLLYPGAEKEPQQHQQVSNQRTIPSTSSLSSALENDDNSIKPAISHLDPNIKYLSYLPFGGLTNQFISLEVAAVAARKLNRTLIIPPIISNSHDHDNAHQRWSQFFDLPGFTRLTGIPVLEWETVRQLSHVQKQVGMKQALLRHSRREGPEMVEWGKMAENVTVMIVNGYGSPKVNINLSAWTFAWHFLFRLSFVQPRPRKPESTVDEKGMAVPGMRHNDKTLNMEDLVAMFKNYEEDDDGQKRGGQGPQILFLSHTMGIKNAGHENRYWLDVGRHFHFAPQLTAYASVLIKKVAQDLEDIEEGDINSDGNGMGTITATVTEGSGKQGQEQALERVLSEDEEFMESFDIAAPGNPVPYIAVHVRRGDIWKKCPVKDKASCLPPFSQYAEAVDRAMTVAIKAGLSSDVPVIVATDSDSEDDLRSIQELGWHRLDHEKYETKESLGPFGPALVDAAILARANVFVGSGKSTMSQIAEARQRTWYRQPTLYPHKGYGI
ncbi:hypothetical protein BGX28_004526 [Mortierella sp. GBA30]|nr:hypothetical protein BGX28_004526 [Mortierella sp. GBA30]